MPRLSTQKPGARSALRISLDELPKIDSLRASVIGKSHFRTAVRKGSLSCNPKLK